MTCPFRSISGSGNNASRRGFLTAAGSLLAATGITRYGHAAEAPPETAMSASHVPFLETNQAGIATPQQKHLYFTTFDVQAERRDQLVALFKAWSEAAARMAAGETARPLKQDASTPPADGGAALNLPPARLTLTFGFGAGLFVKDGKDRYGLARSRPDALVDMPKFNGDQLEPARTGGDLAVQACADDPQIAFHAIRELARLAYDLAQLRWVQTGFMPDSPPGATPRNLMGFKDGTGNPAPGGTPTIDQPRGFDDIVWVGDEGPAWMRGGTYLVARRIRIALEHWDRTELDFQEEVIGRHKYSGAPIGKQGEFEPLGLDRMDRDGNSIIADTAHVRLAAASSNGGAQMFRRGYAYNDGATFIAERWPPWRQGMMYDSGLFFIAFQRDPRTAFIRMFDTMAKLDKLNQYTTHTGSGLFACPGGTRDGRFIGQDLFENT